MVVMVWMLMLSGQGLGDALHVPAAGPGNLQPEGPLIALHDGVGQGETPSSRSSTSALKGYSSMKAGKSTIRAM